MSSLEDDKDAQKMMNRFLRNYALDLMAQDARTTGAKMAEAIARECDSRKEECEQAEMELLTFLNEKNWDNAVLILSLCNMAAQTICCSVHNKLPTNVEVASRLSAFNQILGKLVAAFAIDDREKHAATKN